MRRCVLGIGNVASANTPLRKTRLDFRIHFKRGIHACAPRRIQFVHRENSRRKQKTQRRSQPLAANGMASLLQGTLK